MTKTILLAGAILAAAMFGAANASAETIKLVERATTDAGSG